MSDERHRRNFWERRRMSNDPWLWALQDDQVAQSMLIGDSADGTNDGDDDTNTNDENSNTTVDPVAALADLEARSE